MCCYLTFGVACVKAALDAFLRALGNAFLEPQCVHALLHGLKLGAAQAVVKGFVLFAVAEELVVRAIHVVSGNASDECQTLVIHAL
jgi:hypothetical protein